jgi:hypothetical protein
MPTERPQACAIAEALMRVLRAGTYTTVRLYVGPDGVVGFGIGDTGDLDPLCLVGTYTAESTEVAIAEDILAMQREAIA